MISDNFCSGIHIVLDMVSIMIPRHTTDVAGGTTFSVLMSSPVLATMIVKIGVNHEFLRAIPFMLSHQKSSTKLGNHIDA